MKQVPNATLIIYRRLPFSQLFLYQDVEGRNIDLTGKSGRLVLLPTVDAPDSEAVYEFSTLNGKMVLGMGTILIEGLTEVESAAFTWEEAVGHLVIEEMSGDAKVFIYLRFHVHDSTTGVPV